MPRQKPAKPPKKPRPVTRSPAAAMVKGTDLSPEDAAQVWALREERASLREIAAAMKRSLSTIALELSKDPDRHATLIAAQREERAKRWQRVEHDSITRLEHMQATWYREFFHDDGRLKPKKKADFLEAAPRMVAVLRQTAEGAAVKANLIAGDVTERTENVGAPPAETTATAAIVDKHTAIEDAIRLCCPAIVPPEFKAILEERVAAHRKAGTLPAGYPK